MSNATDTAIQALRLQNRQPRHSQSNNAPESDGSTLRSLPHTTDVSPRCLEPLRSSPNSRDGKEYSIDARWERRADCGFTSVAKAGSGSSPSQPERVGFGFETPVLVNNCWSVFFTALSEITSLAAISLLESPWTNSRRICASLSFNDAPCSPDEASPDGVSGVFSVTSPMMAANLGLEPSLYVENQTSAVKVSPLPRCPRHCIDALN